jgi:hypothetical protein
LEYFLGHLESFHIKPGSVLTYVEHIERVWRREGRIIHKPGILESTKKGMQLRQMEAPTAHAVDIEMADALAIIEAVKKVEVKTSLWMLLNSGARVADQRRLPREAVFVGAGLLHVDFVVPRKNGRKVEERFTVTLPLTSEPDDEIKAQLALPKPFTASVRTINGVLKAICPDKEYTEEERCPTSYSFRRLFVNEVINKFTDDMGIVAWSDVIQLTGHQDSKIPRSSYQQLHAKRAREQAEKDDKGQRQLSLKDFFKKQSGR